MVAPSNPSLVTGFVVILFYTFFPPFLLFPLRLAMPSEPKISNHAQNKKYLGEKKHFPRDAPSGRVRKVWVAPRPVRLACQKIITFAVGKTVGLKKNGPAL